MAVIIELHYNGELGYNQSLRKVIEFFKVTAISAEEFLDFKNSPEGLTNRERVFNTYDVKTKIKQDLADPEGEDIKTFEAITSQMPCPVPMVFYIDGDLVTKDVIINQGSLLADNFSVSNLGYKEGEKNAAFPAYTNKFFKENLEWIENNFSDNAHNHYFDSSKRQMLNPTVWVWCKSLNENGEFNSHSIFNLTPFIQGVTINNTETGGNFSIDLLPIEGFMKVQDGEPIEYWHPDKSKYIKFSKNGRDNYHFRNVLNLRGKRKTTDEGYFDENTTWGTRYQNITTNNLNSQDVKVSGDEIITFLRSEVLFKNLIAENDIVFISFHERNITDDNVEDFFVGHHNLVNQEWDMIGLVDTNSTGVTFENSDTTSEISGRDLMKLLLEDGSYFFAKSFANPDDSDTAFDNVDLPSSGGEVNTTNAVLDGKGKSVNRLITTGVINMLFNQEARNVHFVLNLLISRLANVEICHTRLFEHFSNATDINGETNDIRTKFFVPTYETVKEEVDTDEDINKD